MRIGKKQKVEIAKLNEQRVQELERISGLTSEQAKEYLLKTVEEDVKIDTAKMIKEMEAQAKEEVNKKAKGMEGEKRERRENDRALLRGRLMEEMQDRCHMEDEELLERIDAVIREQGRESFLPLKERIWLRGSLFDRCRNQQRGR